ncbi:hypothetical protein BpHYR1_019269 [Brachionus plicatilis]|uniref:Uncharacterized protein n=1 Tax=Brachionus plicatilis TaxID=10195 RepID=A0A3M7PE64_BRAPC|nr:hypothetical protein BpHYR1_019269 [Brachionus plicatilis]
MQKKIATFSLIFALFCVTYTECRALTEENFLKYHSDLFPKEKFGDFIDVLKFLSKRNEFSRLIKLMSILDVKNQKFRANSHELENDPVQEDEENFVHPEIPDVRLKEKRRTFFVGK